jgi:hypothetical protein
MSRSYTSSPPSAFMACIGTALPYYYYWYYYYYYHSARCVSAANAICKETDVFNTDKITLTNNSLLYVYLHLLDENGRSCTMRNFIICTHPQISLGKSSQGELGRRGMCHAWERREKCTRFWRESPKERDHWEDQGAGGKMGSEWILGRLAWGGGIGFDCLRTGTGGRLLWVR